MSSIPYMECFEMNIKQINTIPDRDDFVLVWRVDQRCWQIANTKSFRHWIGNDELAYTHWAPLPNDPT